MLFCKQKTAYFFDKRRPSQTQNVQIIFEKLSLKVGICSYYFYFRQSLLERLLDCFVDSVEGAPSDKVLVVEFILGFISKPSSDRMYLLKYYSLKSQPFLVLTRILSLQNAFLRNMC
jgi:hypothetical protein